MKSFESAKTVQTILDKHTTWLNMQVQNPLDNRAYLKALLIFKDPTTSQWKCCEWRTKYSSEYSRLPNEDVNTKTLGDLCTEELSLVPRFGTEDNYQEAYSSLQAHFQRIRVKKPLHKDLLVARKHTHGEQAWIYDVLVRKARPKDEITGDEPADRPEEIIIALFQTINSCDLCDDCLNHLTQDLDLQKLFYEAIFQKPPPDTLKIQYFRHYARECKPWKADSEESRHFWGYEELGKQVRSSSFLIDLYPNRISNLPRRIILKRLGRF